MTTSSNSYPNRSQSSHSSLPNRAPGVTRPEGHTTTARTPSATRPAASRAKQKENNLVMKGMIAAASIVVTLSGWGIFAAQDAAANAVTNQVASSDSTVVASANVQQNALRQITAPQVQQRQTQSRPLFITRTRSSR